MMRLKRLSLVLAGSLLVGSVAGSVSAQPWTERDRNRDWDRGRESRDPDWQDRDWRDRDRSWDRDRDRRWRSRDRGPDCYYVRREYRDRFGDLVIRRYRVCED